MLQFGDSALLLHETLRSRFEDTAARLQCRLHEPISLTNTNLRLKMYHHIMPWLTARRE